MNRLSEMRKMKRLSKKKTAKIKSRVGGFVARNTGEIADCYSVTEIDFLRRGKSKVVGGFVAQNAASKTINHSLYSGFVKKYNGGFFGTKQGAENSLDGEDVVHFFHDIGSNPPKSSTAQKRLEKLCDTSLGKHYTEVYSEKSLEKLGYDTDETWEYIGANSKKPPKSSKTAKTKTKTKVKQRFNPLKFIRFKSDNWIYDLPQGEIPEDVEDNNSTVLDGDENTFEFTKDEFGTIIITTADELFEFARQINDSSDESLLTSCVRLENSLDLGGRKWTPIGLELTTAFAGVFDGGGFTVKNFVVRGKEAKVLGFFGYLKGEVYNLTVDCCIKSRKGVTTGGIAAYSDKGIIGCCASVSLTMCKNSGDYGGLAGVNTGKIFNSYSAGEIRKNLLLPPLLLLPLWVLPLLLSLFIPMLYRGTVGEPYIPVFRPIPYEPEIVRREPTTPSTSSNLVAFNFDRTIRISMEDGDGSVNFMNPGISNHNVVFELYLVGEVDGRALIARSGTIPPGFELERLRLLPAGERVNLLPGTFAGRVRLVFYDISTHSRSFVDSQLDVVVNIS
jgi:hypothetical protein